MKKNKDWYELTALENNAIRDSLVRQVFFYQECLKKSSNDNREEFTRLLNLYQSALDTMSKIGCRAAWISIADV